MKLGNKLIRALIKLYQGHCRMVVTVGDKQNAFDAKYKDVSYPQYYLHYL